MITSIDPKQPIAGTAFSSEEQAIRDDPQGVRALLAYVWQRRWFIVLVTALATVAAAVLALTATPFYRSTVVLVPASAERGGIGAGLGAALGQIGGLASIAGINVNDGSIETEEALAVLRSREFTESFINDKQLMPKLFPNKWDGSDWKADETPPTPAQAYKYFHRRVRSVMQDTKTGLVTLQVDWRDSKEAAEWANELIERLNEEMRVRAIQKADASVGYLERELGTTANVATREAISRLMEAQVKQRMLANVTEAYAFRMVDKAMPADANDPIRPKKVMLIAAGFVLGGGMALVLVLLARWWALEGLRSSHPGRQISVTHT